MEVEDIAGVYRRHVAMVRGRALRLLGNVAQAEDVAQETFMRFIDRRKRGESEENTAGLLYRTATNLALNRLRDSKRRRQILDSSYEAPVEPRASLEEKLALRKVLAMVGEDEALIAAYYYVDGLEQEEIAQLLGMQRRTVGRRLERFRERARTILLAEKGVGAHVG